MANADKQRIRICSLVTSAGEWCISADPETFEISGVTYGFPYYLTISSCADFERTADRLHKHITDVTKHQTGYKTWDESSESASAYSEEWKLELDKKFQMRLLGEYLNYYSDYASMREMVDYFEHKHGYLMDRMTILELMEELIITRQIDKLPSMTGAPAEMEGLIELAKYWLGEQ